MKNLDDLVDSMLGGINVLRDKIQELKDKVQEAKSDNFELEHEFFDIEKENEDLERENRELKQKINELKLQADKNERDLNWLDSLRKAGVDNWNGYDYAQELFSEYYPEED